MVQNENKSLIPCFSLLPNLLGTPGETAASTPPTTSTPTQAENQAAVLNDLPPAILALLGSNISVEGAGAPSYVKPTFKKINWEPY